MYKLTKIIDNLKKYGNTKIYLTANKLDNSSFNQVINLKVNDKNELDATLSFEIYDRPYWNGLTLNENAVLKEKQEVYKYNKNDIKFLVSLFIYNSLFKGSYITCEETISLNNSTSVINDIYNLANSMLKLSDNELSIMISSSELDIETLLMNKEENKKIETLQVDVICEKINDKLENINNRLKLIKLTTREEETNKLILK